jgi:hypothetical protein
MEIWRTLSEGVGRGGELDAEPGAGLLTEGRERARAVEVVADSCAQSAGGINPAPANRNIKEKKAGKILVTAETPERGKEGE